MENRYGFPIRSYCRTCGEDFSGDRMFDRHRIGRHEYDFDAEHLDGRRCLDVEEMRAKGWELDERGRWRDPVDSERIRKAHDPG